MSASVSVHRKGDQFSGYKKMIGGTRFYFGESWGIFADKAADKKKAQKAAELLEREYAALKLTDGGWNDSNRPAALNRVRELLGLAAASTPTQQPPKVEEPARINLGASGDPSLAEAIAQYEAANEERHLTKKISAKRLRSIKERIGLAAVSLGDLSAPLSSMRRPNVEAAVNYWLKRPKSERTGEPIAPITVVHRVGALGHFFRWAYDAEKWDGFRAWEKLFTVDTDSLMTAAEKHQAKQPKPKFTVAELGILWASASQRTRLYMLCGLNCGFGQTEIATLRTWDLQLDAAPAVIDRQRNKTGVQGRWELWEETANALKLARNPYSAWGEAIAQQKNAPKYGRTAVADAAKLGEQLAEADDWATLALRTEDGYPLVHDTTDAVRLAWERLYKRAAVKKAVADGRLRKLAFYTLRRTAAQAMRDIAGYETHKVFLAHSSLEASGSQSVSERHYTSRTPADFEKVAAALKLYRLQLQPMFDTKEEQVTKGKPGPKKGSKGKKAKKTVGTAA
jgi:integrase